MSRAYRVKCLESKGEECHLCSSTENIVVHHIDGDRTNNGLDNLIPVCRSCHTDIHYGRNETWSSKLLPVEERPNIRESSRRHIRIPDTVYEEAEQVKEERDFPSIGEAVRHMCQEGDFDV